MADISTAYAINLQVVNASIKCIESERESLLALKQGFVDRYGVLSSWRNDENSKECCIWNGVQCSKRTGHVIKLDLKSNGSSISGTISPSLAELHHLKYLDLSLNYFGNVANFPKFITSLTNLKYLDLSNTQLGGKIPNELGDLIHLRYLNLAKNMLHGEIPPQLGNLSALQFLDLSENYAFAKTDLEWLPHLTSLNSLNLSSIDLSDAKNWIQLLSNLSLLRDLQFSRCNLIDSEPSWPSASLISSRNLSSIAVIDLSINNLTASVFPWVLRHSGSLIVLRLDVNHLSGHIPESLGEFSFLQELGLSGNKLEGEIPKSLLGLCSLRELSLAANNLSGRLDEFVPTHSLCAEKSLERLSLSSNQIGGFIPDFSKFSSLQWLDLSFNQLNGSLTDTIGQLSNLELLTLQQNYLQGVVSQAHFLKLSKLRTLDLSFNALIFNISRNWIPPFQLEDIRLVSCKLGPNFPEWLQSQKTYFELDISNAEISDTVPNWFWNLPPMLNILNISHNKLSGEIANLPLEAINFAEIDMSSNMFQGSIPSFLSVMSKLDVSNNKFSQAHSLLCANSTNLSFLDMSDNHLTEELPECLNLKSLNILDLTNNNFFGHIPSSIGALVHIQALHLGYNNFVGGLPVSMSNCTELKILDIIGNNFLGPIPTYIGNTLRKLQVLSLRSNRFNGSFPSSICHLAEIQILDFSLNNISGTIPRCLGNLTLLTAQAQPNATITYYYAQSVSSNTGMLTSYNDSETIIWKGKESQYNSTLGLVRSIDLSSNKLVGKIPKEIMNLTALISLNISRNMLSGEIPEAIGQLRSLDVLDLSWNQLSGRIPSQLSQLGLLGILNLSYNNLSGEIPNTPRLQSFDFSSYMGNPELCGTPLSITCPGKQTDNEHDETEKDDESDFMHGVYISMAMGFIVGFWGVCCSLIWKKSWRFAYFKFMSDMYDKVYVITAINVAKLRTRTRASTRR